VNLLLDTCAFLWLVTGSDHLSPTARNLFSDPDNDVYLSAASAWEISIKWSLGKLPLPVTPEKFVTEQREKHFISPLPISENAAFLLPKLPDHHKDPFDRILICQAIEHTLTILTTDPLIQQYPVRTVW